MKRRDFLKEAGVFASGAIVGAGACELIKNNKNKDNKNNNAANENSTNKQNKEDYTDGKIAQDDIIRMLEKKQYYGWIKHVEFPITHHCNLNCAYCNSMAPIAPAYFLPLDIYKRDIEQMQRITNGKIREIALIGGEPLLNKNIEQYIKIARETFPQSNIRITTNGLLLNNMSDSFWQTCAKYKTDIRYTHYPLSKNYPILLEAHKKAQEYNVNLEIKGSVYHFRLLNLNKTKLNDIATTHQNCEDRRCLLIDNGILYPCPCIQVVNMFYNKHFKNHPIPTNKEEVFDIYKLSSIEDIYRIIQKPKEMCQYCNYTSNKAQDKVWKYSKRELSEWFEPS